MAKRRPSGDGMVRKREDGRWEGRIVVGHKKNGDSIFHYISAPTQKELLLKLHQRIDEYRDVDLTEECKLPLADWLERWLTEYAQPSVREQTYRGYRNYIEKYIIPSLGKMQISKITLNDVQALYLDLLKNGRKKAHPEYGHSLSGATVRSIHGVFHQAMDTAKQAHLIAHNPTEGVTLPKKNPPQKNILNSEQLERFMEEIKKDPIWYDFFFTEITTGLRKGELCGLMWSDFNEQKGTLDIRRSIHVERGGRLVSGETKTGTSKRTLTLPSSTRKVLAKRKRKSCSQWIFHDPLCPEKPMHPHRAYNQLKKILAQAGLPCIRFHDLRHTFATHALTGGVDAKTLSGILGHRKASFTLDTYTHVTNDMHRRAADIVGTVMKDMMVR